MSRWSVGEAAVLAVTAGAGKKEVRLEDAQGTSLWAELRRSGSLAPKEDCLG